MEATDHLKASLVAAIALANTFGSGERQGRAAVPPDEAAIDAVLRLTTNRSGPVDPAGYEAGARVLYDALDGLPDLDRAGALVNELLRETRATPQLTRDEGAPWHLHFGNPDEASGWLAEFATAVAMLLGSDEVERVRRCEATRCDDLFLDSTRNRTQRFCSTACQNRTKVAAHRARSA
ncbi:CGNR zinc finger domain-containing protein [Kribbella sp. NPDC026611]|uniref:CGNR zinc finger domain-containing protein n=1 Tax=Kribbella sp. NPDC026611 TaxID=3154911 RepID=UPI0033F1CCC4